MIVSPFLQEKKSISISFTRKPILTFFLSCYTSAIFYQKIAKKTKHPVNVDLEARDLLKWVHYPQGPTPVSTTP